MTLPSAPDTSARAATREAERRIDQGADRDELARRLRQQAVLSDFGRLALECRDLDVLLQRACELCADALQTPLAKVLAWEPGEDRFLIRAGVGWRPGVVGQTLLGADLESPAGFAFHTGRSVISNHLSAETRFRTPELMAEHGVKRAMNVLLQAGETPPFGVLEVDSPDEGDFGPADLAYLQSFANLLGVAIERDRAETRLAESRDLARLVVEGARDLAIFTTDPAGRVNYWNSGAQAVFGYAEEEILGRDAALLFTPEDQAEGLPARELETAREAGCADDERFHLRKDGTRFWASGSARPLRDPDGRTRGFVKICRDETRRRRAAEELRASEERFRLVTQATTDVIWDWDLATDTVSWSDAMRGLAGEPEAVPTLAWWEERLHPEDRARVVDSLHAAVTGDAERWREEYRFRRGDGGYADVVDQGFVLRDAQGRAVRMIGGMLDVTDLKSVEAALREARERLHAALDAAEMGALDFDPASGDLHLDARCMRLLGLSPDAEMDFARLLECVGPQEREAISGAVRQALDPAGPGEFYVEIAVQSPEDGQRHWVAARGRLLATPHKAPRVVGIAFDVTYRRRAEELMREALEHQAMLVREVSHRVKNSLQLVAGVLALQARSAKHEEVRQALTVAQTRLQTIGQVHDQLWRQPDMQEVELGAFLRSLCDKLQESAAGHAVTFAGEPVPISADRAIPVALLVNELVTNALKYAYPGAGGPVEVSLKVDGERLTLEVSDRGVGLPPGLDPTEAGESLGMRVVTGLVRQLRAELETGSNDPSARFVLRFDRAEPEAEAGL